MRTLAEEIEAYLATKGEEPRLPPSPEVLSRWVKRAATLAAVRDELRQEVAELKERVKMLETLNGMLHANPPFSIMPTEYRGKLESVVEAAKPAAKALRFWLESDIMCECDGGIHTCGYTERVQELNELEQALAALEEDARPTATGIGPKNCCGDNCFVEAKRRCCFGGDAMIYDLLKQIVLDCAPGAGCPSEWGLIDADYCDSFCDSASDTCQKCWQAAIEEKEGAEKE